MTRAYHVVSVGTHVNPLPSMWAERIAPEYRDRAPRPVRRTDPELGEIETLLFEGREQRFNLVSADAGRPSPDVVPQGRTFSDGLRGGWDPAARLIDQDKDGVDADVIFDGVTPLSTPDRGLKHAMIQAYNDWLADFCAARARPSRRRRLPADMGRGARRHRGAAGAQTRAARRARPHDPGA